MLANDAVEALGLRGNKGTVVMGILNVTPDSFSDGNLWFEPAIAVKHGVRMRDEGATVVDVGGESTRPGARRVSASEEWQRIAPVIRGLVSEDVTVSVDTVNASTAALAIEHGAALINDVSGGLHDPAIAEVIADWGGPMVVQHWRGFPADPSLNETYLNPVREVVDELKGQVARLTSAGVTEEQIILDPGLGFAKDADVSWLLVENLDQLTAQGFPVLIGGSRKRFVAAKFGSALEEGTLAVTEQAVRAKVWGVRVHSVAENVARIESLQPGQPDPEGGAG